MPSELKVLHFAADEQFGRESLDGPPVVSGHIVRGVAEGFTGLAKSLLLGAAALKDLLGRTALSEREASRAAIFVNLSDHFVQDAAEAGSPKSPSAAWKYQSARLIPKLLAHVGLPIFENYQSLRHGGHAGFAQCVEEAALQLAKGSVDRCLVGGIDSRCEPGFLMAAATLNVLRTADNPTGLTPGEAAAFVLLERTADIGRAGRSAVAIVTAATSTREPNRAPDDEIADGIALARVISGVLGDSSASRPVALTIGDLNGTTRRAQEWGNALARLRLAGPLGNLPLWLPATSFGDTGAASGGVALCMAARAFERGYGPAGEALVWSSSESGGKGAIALAAQRG